MKTQMQRKLAIFIVALLSIVATLVSICVEPIQMAFPIIGLGILMFLNRLSDPRGDFELKGIILALVLTSMFLAYVDAIPGHLLQYYSCVATTTLGCLVLAEVGVFALIDVFKGR